MWWTRWGVAMHRFILYCRHAMTLLFFFFNDPATTEIYTLSLHDALPISSATACVLRLAMLVLTRTADCASMGSDTGGTRAVKRVLVQSFHEAATAPCARASKPITRTWPLPWATPNAAVCPVP